nr:MAG TPA: hypothetical protein [Caudoviricetes sp.]
MLRCVRIKLYVLVRRLIPRALTVYLVSSYYNNGCFRFLS